MTEGIKHLNFSGNNFCLKSIDAMCQWMMLPDQTDKHHGDSIPIAIEDSLRTPHDLIVLHLSSCSLAHGSICLIYEDIFETYTGYFPA
jgi:hypothetical protein